MRSKEADNEIHAVSTTATAPVVTEVPSGESLSPNGRRVLDENDKANAKHTAYAWSKKKKWILLTVVALCQTSMNFNAAVYSNAIEGINEQFGVKNARMGMVAFLITYAFGCELWAPWSEELGRWIIMQLSLSCVNISIIICAVAPNFATILAGRAIGGLSSAGGSVTLGMVADMFDSNNQQFAVAWASLWSCLGGMYHSFLSCLYTVIGAICGGPIQQYLPWRYNFWIQLAFSLATQIIHFFIAKESRATCMLDTYAKKKRKNGNEIYGPNEVRSLRERFDKKKILETMWRPYWMLMSEPIVLWLSLLSGFADALIFSFFESYGYVFGQWGYTPVQISLAMLPLFASYWVAYFSFFPVVKKHNKQRREGKVLAPETRLWWLLFQVVLLPAGLLGCALLSRKSHGPAGVIAFSFLIGMANFSIYYATVDYMVAAYAEYSASATGGNGFCRDFLAGVCSFYTGPMYKNLGIRNAQLLLFGIGAAFCFPVFAFYHWGPEIRQRSKFAQQLAAQHDNAASARAHADDFLIVDNEEKTA
ncbi:major facilitator superfamily domain-containing protein [Lophiotrema nucula]|uniref:Major facilitator superfamily domain-containing protein n=1 Tax=Lophiotrema nucula TaxID=690887 RepID=A0A6A5YY43_9PLEO|nr:major facilitator superfamily domain-containing protein [Lophiotrema nucula]